MKLILEHIEGGSIICFKRGRLFAFFFLFNQFIVLGALCGASTKLLLG